MNSIILYTYGRSTVNGCWQIDKSRIVNRLYYVNSGSAVIETTSHKYSLAAGKIYIIPQCKSFSPISANSFDHTYFDFYSSRVMRRNTLIELNKNVFDSDIFFEYINRLIDKGTDKTARHAINCFISGFLKLTESMYPDDIYISNMAVTNAVNIIHNEYNHITTKILAKRLNLDKSYFIRLFSSSMGISPMKYIRAVRVEFGKEFIKNGKSICEAAEMCGYSSASAFYNAVKAELQTSPSAFKNDNSY